MGDTPIVHDVACEMPGYAFRLPPGAQRLAGVSSPSKTAVGAS
jgi:hypothetical protein